MLISISPSGTTANLLLAHSIQWCFCTAVARIVVAAVVYKVLHVHQIEDQNSKRSQTSENQ
jgi:Na+/H+ antiporter NhaC